MRARKIDTRECESGAGDEDCAVFGSELTFCNVFLFRQISFAAANLIKFYNLILKDVCCLIEEAL